MSDEQREIEELRARLGEAEDTLQAIRTGDVDALVVEGPDGRRVYTLVGAEQPYRVLVEAMDEGAVTLDEDGTILYSNLPFAALVGVPLEQLLGSSMHQFVAPADDTSFRLLLGRRRGKAEVVFNGRGTPPAPTYLSVSPLGTSKVCVVVTDLTGQKRNEERLAAAQFARSVFEHATEAIVVCDERGRITHASVAAEAFCGRSAIGEFIGDAFPLEHPSAQPDDGPPAPMISCLAETHLGRALRGVEGVFHCQDPPPRHISISSGPLVGSSEEIIGSIFTLTDITDRMRIGEARREAAEAANRAKDEFLAMLSHEMRSPLGAITIWASLLRMGKLPPEKTAHAIGAIERNAGILSRFIEELLDVSRIVSGKLALDVQSVDLAAVVDAALDTVRAAADAKGIRLERLIDSAAQVVGDSTRLQQVVSNLLTNAVKFSARGGRVLLRVVAEGSHAVISVRDVGEGIAATFLPRIFDRYRQASDTSTRVHGGLGLGLAIVREIVELHHGTVTAESAGPGQGATFTVTLPFLDSPDALARDRVIVDAAGPAPRIGSILAGVRVLLVEDDAEVRTALLAALELNGASVTTAASAAEGVARLSRDHPDVLVSDITMPGDDGHALIRRIRGLKAERGGRVPPAAVTDDAATHERAGTLGAGYQLHLTRPVDASALIAAVAKMAAVGVPQVLPG
jgi:PAS domain S-box-containing protein